MDDVEGILNRIADRLDALWLAIPEGYLSQCSQWHAALRDVAQSIRNEIDNVVPDVSRREGLNCEPSGDEGARNE